MTPSVAIGGGKQTVQRISIRFPKREGQSRIRIPFQAVERGGPFGSSAITISSTAWRVVKETIARRQLLVILNHPICFLARPLVKLFQEPASGFAKIFHVFLQQSSDAFEYASGVVRNVGKAVQRIGKIVHERH